MAKVMLVEDDNNLREIYEARLQAEGYTIVSAKDGEEALVVAKAEKPDLIISDVMMPKISGFEMLDILRNTEQLKEVKIIMLTALGQSDDQQRADHLGADRYLVKSQVTLEDIVKATHELLGDQAISDTTPAPAAPATDAKPAAPEPAVADKPAPEAPTAVPPPAPAPTEPVAAPPVVEEPAPPAVAPVASQPESKTADEPAPDASKESIPAVDKSDVQSTLQEEAAVENKIENFVAGATQEATPPSSPTPSPVPDDTATPDDQDDKTASAAADDKLLDDAAEALQASTKEPETPDPEPAATPAPGAEPAAETSEESSTGSVPIANKKVITPLNDKPKKGIDELLAIEEAKEAKTAKPTTSIPVIAGDDNNAKPAGSSPTPAVTPPTGAAQAGTVIPPSSGPVDPNSIAL